MNKLEIYYYAQTSKCNVHYRTEELDGAPFVIFENIPWSQLPYALGAFTEYGKCDIEICALD